MILQAIPIRLHFQLTFGIEGVGAPKRPMIVTATNFLKESKAVVDIVNLKATWIGECFRSTVLVVVLIDQKGIAVV